MGGRKGSPATMNTEPRYPDAEPGYFRISNSSIEDFLRCGLFFWYRREGRDNRDRGFATIPMAIGTAVSAAAELACVRKKAEKDLPTLRELVDAAVAVYDAEHEISVIEAAPVQIDQGRDDAAGAARAWGELIMPTVGEVLWAEEPLIARFAEVGLELAGTPDLVEPDLIRDTKTGRSWDQRSVDRSRQLTGYGLLYRGQVGARPSRVAIDNVHRSRRGGWTAKTLWSSRCERDEAAYLEIAQRVHDAIKKGVAVPAPEGAWWCSDGWCPFWDRCTSRPGA